MVEKTIRTQKVFSGRVLRLEVLDVELENGQKSVREIIRHQGAAGVLGRLPDGRFAFVRQFRKAVEDYRLEIVAGILDPGETPETCARRELREETGYAARSLRHLGSVNASPGYTSEFVEVFFAELEHEPGQTDPDEDEHVHPVFLTREEFIARVIRGEVQDSKTLAAWLLYEKIVGDTP